MTRPVVVRIDGDPKGLLKALNSIDSRLGRSEQRAQAFGRTVGAAFALGSAVQGLRSVVQAAGEFDTTVREAGSAANANAKQLKTLGDAAREAGIKQKVGATQAAAAQRELARAGLSVQQIIGGGMTAALNLAAASGEDVAKTSGIVADALNAFGLSGKDATKVADQLTTSANATTSSVTDSGAALAQAGAAAKVAGLSLTDTNVALTALAKLGVKGSDAGTSLKAALIQVTNATPKAKAAMEKYNLEFYKGNGQIKGTVEIAGMLRKQLGGLTNEQRQQVLATIAGTDGFRSLVALYQQGRTGAEQLERAMYKQGVAAKQAADRNKGTGGSIREATAAWEEAKLKVADVAAPVVTRELQKFSKAIAEADRNGSLNEGLRDLGTVLEGVADAGEAAVRVGSGIAKAWSAVPGPVREAAIAFGMVAVATRKLAGLGLPMVAFGGGVGSGAAGAGGRGARGAAGMGAAETLAAGGGQPLAAVIARRRAALAERRQQMELARQMRKQAEDAAKAAAWSRNNLYTAAGGGFGNLALAAQVRGREAEAQRLAQAAAAQRAAARSVKIPSLLSMPAGGTLAKGAAVAGGAGALGTAIGGSFLEKVAAGAAVGSVGGPWGMAGGAVAAAAGAGLQKFFEGKGKEKLRDALKDVEKGPGQDLTRDSQQRLAELKRRADEERRNNYVGDGRGGLVRKIKPDAGFVKAQTDYGTAAGREQVDQRLRGRKNVSVGLLAGSFTQANRGLEPEAKAAAAKQWMAYLGELEAKGKVAKGSVKRFAKEVGASMNDALKSEVSKAGKGIDLETALTKSAGKSRGKLASILRGQEKDIAGLRKAHDTSFRGIVASADERMGQLQQIMRDTSGTSKDVRIKAAAEYRRLKAAIKEYIGDSGPVFFQFGQSAKGGFDTASSGADTLKRKIGELSSLAPTIRNVGDAIATAMASPGFKGGKKDNRRGGLNFAGGGLVDIRASSGELAVEPSGRAYVIPGPRVAADNVPMSVPSGTAIFTEGGQRMLADGMDPMAVLSSQPAHFAGGGIVKGAFRSAVERGRVMSRAGVSYSIRKAFKERDEARSKTLKKDVRDGKYANNLDGWLRTALEITGHYTPANLAALKRRAMQESGGNPRAINLWDSNAKKGTPSKGLLQTIGPTFSAHKLPGYGNIWNPVHNAVAAIRYMYSRYGHIVDANGRGYARGGVVGGTFGSLPIGGSGKAFGKRFGPSRDQRVLAGLSMPAPKNSQALADFATGIDELTAGGLFRALGVAERELRTAKTSRAKDAARAAISIIDDRLGGRIGSKLNRAEFATGAASSNLSTLQQMQRIAGTDGTSAGLLSQQRQAQRGLAQMESSRGGLVRALSIAQRKGDRDTIAKVTESLTQLDQQILSTRGDIADLGRSAAAAALEETRAKRVGFQATDDFNAAMARLTESTDDDKQVLEQRRANTQAALDQALAAGDTEQATELANQLADLNETIKASNTSAQEQLDATNQQNELLRQIKDGQDAVVRLVNSQQPDKVLAALVNTGLGGGVFASAGFPVAGGSRW